MNVSNMLLDVFKWHPGEKLDLDKLQELTGLTRKQIYNALQVLQTRNGVEHADARGFYVYFPEKDTWQSPIYSAPAYAMVRVTNATKERLRIIAAVTDMSQGDIINTAIEEYVTQHSSLLKESLERVLSLRVQALRRDLVRGTYRKER